MGEDTEKPENIMLHIYIKDVDRGVDMVDQFCFNYNCARKTKRGPLVMLYSSLNVAGINSFLIYCSNNSSLKIPRRKFLKSLSMEKVRHIYSFNL